MTRIVWDAPGTRRYETGVDRGVLFRVDGGGAYANGYGWNGLVSVTESPSGAESNKQYADNIPYLNLLSLEQFGATLEAFTYPAEFEACDGLAEPSQGITLGQQPRETFGLCYRTKVGTDLGEVGYKVHMVYGALAAPSQRAYTTVNDSPEAITMSWDITTTPVDVPGYKPSASMVIDSTKVDPTALATLEDVLYGTSGDDPRLPLPAEIVAMFEGSVTQVSPTKPAFASNVITIPTVTGVIYKIDGVVKPAGTVTITTDTVVNAVPAVGYKFPPVTDDDWLFVYAP